MPSDALPPAVILVVDDEEGINRLVTRYLTHLGYRVLDATSGTGALAVVHRAQPQIDLVLADVVMPGMSGIELAAALLASCPGPSVILMTGQLPEDVERINVGGQIVRVMRKPLDLDELRQLLQVTLEGYPPDEEAGGVNLAG